MSEIKRIVISVRKKIHPNALEFGLLLSQRAIGQQIKLQVTKADERTESMVVDIVGSAIQYADVANAITSLGGAIQSIDAAEIYTPESDSKACTG